MKKYNNRKIAKDRKVTHTAGNIVVMEKPQIVARFDGNVSMRKSCGKSACKGLNS